MYGTGNFFKYLYENLKEDKLIHLDEENLEIEIELKRKKLREILKLNKLESFNFTPNYSKINKYKFEKYEIEEFNLEILPKLITPFFVVKPENPNGKVVVYVQGHGNGIKDELGLKHVKDLYSNNVIFHLVNKGYTIVTSEQFGYGDLQYEDTISETEKTCYANTTILAMFGLNIIGLRVYQVLECIKYSKGISDKIYLYGMSGGGLVAGYTNIFTKNLKGTIIASYANTFKDSIMSMHHCVCNFVPDIFSIGESYEILSLAVPNKTMIVSGKKDMIFPIDGLLKAYSYMEIVYEMYNAKDNISLEIFRGGHEADIKSLLKFLEKN